MINFGHGVFFHALNEYNKAWYLANRNEYKIWKWCRQNDLINDQNHESWMEKQAKDPTTKMYDIAILDENGLYKLVGVCGLTDIDRINQRAEFSLYIFRDYHRKGYAKAALKTLFSHGFMNQNLNVIWGETFEGNPAYDMFLKLGMKHEGTRRQFYYKEGKHIDAHLVSMTKAEFMEAPWRQPQCY